MTECQHGGHSNYFLGRGKWNLFYNLINTAFPSTLSLTTPMTKLPNNNQQPCYIAGSEILTWFLLSVPRSESLRGGWNYQRRALVRELRNSHKASGQKPSLAAHQGLPGADFSCLFGFLAGCFCFGLGCWEWCFELCKYSLVCALAYCCGEPLFVISNDLAIGVAGGVG